MRDRNFTIVDVETTGGSPFFSRIIEVGILRLERGDVVDEYRSFINPQCQLPEFITKLTGITQEHVDTAPEFETVAEEVLALFEDATLVAHNSNFDYHFLKQEFRRCGLAFTLDTLCTVRLSRVLYPKFKRHNLSALVERFNFQCERRHRALEDAKVLWDFLQQVEKDFPEPVVATAIERTIKKIPPKKQFAMPAANPAEISYHPE